MSNSSFTPFISFCVPVYNRQDFIESTLLSLLAQECSCSFEVVVSDNSSTDSTVNIIENLCNRYPNLRLISLPFNQGADSNFLSAVSHARGKYCWLFGSDDILLPGSLQTIIEKLVAYNPNICIASHFLGDINAMPYSVKYLLNSALPSNLYDFSDLKQFSTYIKAATSQSSIFCFLSNLVFRRDDWNSVPTDKKYIGSLYVHAHKLFSIATSVGPSIFYCRDPLVIWRGGNDSFGGPGKFFFRYSIDFNGFRMFHDDYIPPEISNDFKKLFRRHHSFLNICYLRLHSSHLEFKSIVSSLKWYGYPRLLILLISPSFVARLLLGPIFFVYSKVLKPFRNSLFNFKKVSPVKFVLKFFRSKL